MPKSRNPHIDADQQAVNDATSEFGKAIFDAAFGDGPTDEQSALRHVRNAFESALNQIGMPLDSQSQLLEAMWNDVKSRRASEAASIG